VSIVALAAEGSTYEAPGVSDFWQPLIGEGAFAITRASVVIILSVALISWLLLAGTKRMAVVPNRKQAATEVTYGLVRDGVGRDIIGSKEFLRFVPLLFTLFTLIIVNNVFSIIPVVQFPTMSRVAFPAALALFVFCVYHWIGIRKHGFLGYWKSLVPPGLPVALIPYIFILELITDLFTRPVTLALRLFGNMFAGHLLLVLFIGGGEYMIQHGAFGIKIAGIGSLGMGFVMTVFEILVQVLQAYIFTLLTAIYIAGALADEH
jgi:F-type H+-transporting ATPase subunit a